MIIQAKQKITTEKTLINTNTNVEHDTKLKQHMHMHSTQSDQICIYKDNQSKQLEYEY